MTFRHCKQAKKAADGFVLMKHVRKIADNTNQEQEGE